MFLMISFMIFSPYSLDVLNAIGNRGPSLFYNMLDYTMKPQKKQVFFPGISHKPKRMLQFQRLPDDETVTAKKSPGNPGDKHA